MTPLLLLTHGDFGARLLEAASAMLGPQPSVLALGLALEEDREAYRSRLRAARAQLGGALLYLVDLPGGPRWNTALALDTLKEGDEVVSGLSLPLLLEALHSRATADPRRLGEMLVERAAQGVWRASARLGGASKGAP